MKEGLIKISDEENLFYDSVDRLYRYRMRCPYCGKVSGCRCFDKLEKAEDFMIDSVDFVCSNKCSLMILIDEQGIDDIGDTMKDMGRGDWNLLTPLWLEFINRYVRYYISIWRLKWYIFKYTRYMSEKDCYKVLDTMDLDYDSIEGESC